MTATKKRDRKANFTDSEICALLEALVVDRPVTQCKLQSGVSVCKKNEAWVRVNAVSLVAIRTVDDCRKKWKDLKSAVLKEQAPI